MKRKIVSNMIWRWAERMGAQAIEFVVTIILARILGPDAYGKVALLTAFTTILQVFVDGGLGNALIQKKDADDVDFSSVFYFNIFFCTLIYILLFCMAPYIAALYEDSSMASMVRVACIIVIISSVKNVQQARISRNLQFKKFFFSTIVGTCISAIVGIVMAISGFGAWSLVAQKITNTLIDTIVVWISGSWMPKWAFSFKKLAKLLSYGWKLLASNLIDVIYGNMQQLIIGKFYSSSDLAYYNRGSSMPNVIVKNVNTSIDSVLFPVMSLKQDNPEEVRMITRRAIMMSNYVMAPLMMGMAFMADSIVKVLLTESWIDCVFYLRVFCVIYMFQPIHTANINAVKAMGRSDLFLKIEIIKKIIGLLVLVVSMHYGMKAMTYSYLFYTILNQVINSWPNRRLLNYKYIDQIKDIMPSTILAVIMGICVYGISLFNLNILVTIAVQVLAGFMIYFLGSVIFRLEAYWQVWEAVKVFCMRRTDK